MIKIILGLVLIVVLASLAFSLQTPSAYALKTISLQNGGDCSNIGTWSSATSTCTLGNDTNDGIVIGDNNIMLDGNGHTISGTSGNGVIVQIKQGVTIKNLKIQNFGTGINIDNSISTTLSGNTISNSQGAGISSTSSNNLVLTNNVLSNNNGGITISGTFGTTLTSNTVSNDKSYAAILISGSSNSVLTSNTVTNNGVVGIETVSGSDGSTLTSNTVSSNGGIGVYIVSSNNIVTKNTISNNGNAGIYVSGGGTQITHNTISNNLHGIDSGYAITAYDNTISGNKLGIAASGGTYYNNNLINNAVQVSGAFSSTFSLNPPTGGNYWSDYSSSAQGCVDLNSDSFCDTPYPFNGGTVGVADKYPWTIQNGWHTVITTSGNITASVVGNATGKSVTYSVSATQDSSPVSVNCTPSSGSTFPIGTTTVVCTASTGVKTSFGVTVKPQPPADTISPVVSVPTNQVVTATSSNGMVVNYPQATATDNIGVTNGPTCTPSSGSVFPVGVTTVTCTASDAAGNVGKATFTITVNTQQTTSPQEITSFSTDKSSYSSGNEIRFSGTAANSGAPITILIYDPNNKFVILTSGIANSNNAFQVVLDTSTPSTQQYISLQGTYTATAFTTDKTKGATTTFYFSPSGNIPTQSSNTITIAQGSGSSASAACVTTNNCFSPNPLYVSLGTSVTWTNTDTLSHTVTSGKVSDDNAGSLFDSGLIKSGNTFQFTFTNAGTYDYHCTVHPWMTGQVIVGNNIQPTPTPQPSTITATTDKSSYNAGDSIVVSGTINHVNSVNPEQPVTIQTYDMYNVLVRIDQAIPSPSGTFSVTIPAHGALWQNTGTYTLKAVYDSPNSASKMTFYFNSGITQTPPMSAPQTQSQINIAVGAGSSASAACVTTNNCFSPNPAYVTPGTTVTWTNNDKLSHTVTSGKVSDDNSGSLFDSGLVKAGGSFQFTFANAGAYDYFCTVHPWMTGKVIVGSTSQQVTNPSLNELLEQRKKDAERLQELLHAQNAVLNTTQQDIQNINQAKANQTIAAEINVGNNKTETTSIDNNVSVQTTQNTPDLLGVQVSASSQTGPKVISFNLAAKSINVENLKDLGVMYDGKLIAPAPNMDAILHAKPTDNPSFAIVVTQSGVQVLVLVPHFSTHTITITNMSKVIPVVPEFGSVAGVIITISVIGSIAISRKFSKA